MPIISLTIIWYCFFCISFPTTDFPVEFGLLFVWLANLGKAVTKPLNIYMFNSKIRIFHMAQRHHPRRAERSLWMAELNVIGLEDSYTEWNTHGNCVRLRGRKEFLCRIWREGCHLNAPRLNESSPLSVELPQDTKGASYAPSGWQTCMNV